MDRDKYKLLIFESIIEINYQLPSEKQISQDLSTILVGPNSELDSLSLINLIIDIEERINTSLGKRIQILDRGIMSEEHGGFKTIDELINWIIKEA